MKLPKRPSQHITETESFKIFSNCIPNHWIIREITQRDYGIDCYIELVDNENQVTGDLISIQLKGKDTVKWTKDNHYTLSGIDISTTNYWYRFSTPVFIVLVDIQKNEVFFCPVKSTLRKNFIEFAKQSKFSYRIERNNSLDSSNIDRFVFSYFREKKFDRLEKSIITFVSRYQLNLQFLHDNTGLDVFLGVEDNRIIFMEHLYYNIKFLCKYFNINWELKSLQEYYKVSQEKFGNDYYIYEEQISEIATELITLVTPILLKLRKYITVDFKEYWISNNLLLFNLMCNVTEDGEMPYETEF